MTIIIDAMGGQRAPEAPLRAAAQLSLHRDLELLVVGDERLITERLARLPHNPARLMVHHGGSAPDECIDAAVARLASDRGAALVTAGTPDHVVPAAARHLTLASGVTRPALCAVYPTARRRGRAKDPFVLILDVGADFSASAEDLVGFAHMGAAYAARISHNPSPRVGVLGCKIGDQHGPPEAAEAAARLRADPPSSMRLAGLVEGLEIPRGGADVIVCSGAAGNVVVKLLEGVGEVVTHLARSVREQSIKARIALQAISGDMDSFASITDWKEYGGAPLLGYDRPLILTEPGADAEAFERAIRLAAKTIRTDIIGAIAR